MRVTPEQVDALFGPDDLEPTAEVIGRILRSKPAVVDVSPRCSVPGYVRRVAIDAWRNRSQRGGINTALGEVCFCGSGRHGC